jgi:hypothetical protein
MIRLQYNRRDTGLEMFAGNALEVIFAMKFAPYCCQYVQ